MLRLENLDAKKISDGNLVSEASARGLIWRSRDTGETYATAAGIVLLAKDPSMFFPQCCILADAYRSTEPDGDPRDHEDIRGPMPVLTEFEGHYDDMPGVFSLMNPIEHAVDSFNELSALFDTCILSTSPWENPSATSDKLLWVKCQLGAPAYKRFLPTHYKNLKRCDFLIDDRLKHGVDRLTGQHIHFGSERFAD